MNRYAVSIFAQKPLHGSCHCALVVDADSIEAAEAIGLDEARKIRPGADGWRSHSATAEEIPDGPASTGRRPCPWCKTISLAVRPDPDDHPDDFEEQYRYVECQDCGACGPLADSEAAAIARWDARRDIG